LDSYEQCIMTLSGLAGTATEAPITMRRRSLRRR
jgi:hypothetical protein